MVGLTARGTNGHIDMPPLYCLQHVPFEGPAQIAVWARNRGHELKTVLVANGIPTTEILAAAGLVIMGGPMNVAEQDRYPWLDEEKALLRRFIETGKPMFGVCLGAQLLADALGAAVTRQTQREIGWLPIHFTEQARTALLPPEAPSDLEVLHWHGDTFALPAGLGLAMPS